MSYYFFNWTYEGVCVVCVWLARFSVRCWPFQVHSLEPQSGVAARLCSVRLWQAHKQTFSPVCLQVVCPLSHSSKTTTTTTNKKQPKKSTERMTWLRAQICVTEACDFSIMSAGLSLFPSQTLTFMWLTGSDPGADGAGRRLRPSCGNRWAGIERLWRPRN